MKVGHKTFSEEIARKVFDAVRQSDGTLSAAAESLIYRRASDLVC